MDSVPDYAAVSETVRISRKKCPGLSGLVNGVLRAYLRTTAKRELPDRETHPADYLSVKYSCSRPLAALWIRERGTDRAEALLSACNQPPQLTICANTLKTTRSVLAETLTAEGFEVRVPETGSMPEDQAAVIDAHALYVSGSGILNTDAFRKGLPHRVSASWMSARRREENRYSLRY